MRFRFITIDQPAGRFYISKINAETLISISQSNTRSPYNSTGIQRKINDDRVKEIAKYCESKTAMFPTPIILSGDSNYFKFYPEDKKGNCPDGDEEKNRDNDEIYYENLDFGYLDIDIKKIQEDKRFLSIVDGQHRLAGIAQYGKDNDKAKEFDLLAMFVFDTQAYQDAEIFSIINRNQKQVSRSLVYDLYGLTDEMTVEKFAHEIVKALNTEEYSLLKDRIKMLGYKIDSFNEYGEKIKQYVSQATIVDELISMISKNVYEDNQFISNGEAIKNPNDNKLILRKYFYNDDLYCAKAILIGFYNAWIEKIKDKFSEDSIIFKTVGFITSLLLFKNLYTRLDINDEISQKFKTNNRDDINKDEELVNMYKIKFLRLINNLDFDSVVLDSISSSRSGATKLFNILIKNI